MTRPELIRCIHDRQSFLCVGLDPDLSRIPLHLHTEEDVIFAFNKSIIDATRDLCVAYKPNLAFYESLGLPGWRSLQKTVHYLRAMDEHLIIADAKRGDIGNTAQRYAKAFFEQMECDAITVAPYMGADSVSPFLEYHDKWVALLALTSNAGSLDFQHLKGNNGQPIWQQLLEKAVTWASPDQLMFVVGATHPQAFADVRSIAPNHFLLVPGVGAQGGKVAEVCREGLNSDIGLLINSSRGILYAGADEHFAEASRAAAQSLVAQMRDCI